MAKEGLPVLVVVWIAAVAAGTAYYLVNTKLVLLVAVFFALFGLFSLYFFRDPRRVIPRDEKCVVSPADGKVVDIGEADEPHFMQGRATRVSIFLSVFDVHVNRFPFDGVVRFKKYFPGRFRAAFKDKASLDNEQTCVGIECRNGMKMTVKQIAGLIARRIVCYADSGRSFAKGERFGMIRFGSRTDLFLPLGTQVKVKVGDRVRGGSSVIGEVP